MKFNTSIEGDLKRAKVRFDYLCEKQKIIELKGCRKPRSLNQNSYLHVVITLYAIEFGYTLNEAKTDLKRMCGFMTYEKNNSRYLKETAKMNSTELTQFIDWIRNLASQNGLYIPDAEEYKTNKHSIDNDINKFKEYL